MSGPAPAALSLPEEPALAAALRQAASAVGFHAPFAVEVVPGGKVLVESAGGAVRRLFGAPPVVKLGFHALRSLSQAEVSALVASGLLARQWTFSSASGKRKRLEAADLAVAQAFGGDVLSSALRREAEAAEAYARNGWGAASALRKAGLPCTDLSACLQAMDGATPEVLRRDRLALRLARADAPFRDTYAARIARIEAAAKTGPAAPATRSEPATVWLRDAAATSAAITRAHVARVEAHLASMGETASAELPLRPGAEKSFCEGIALHDAASELSQRKSDEANPVALAALQKLEQALGRHHPMLVPALANAARATDRMGDPAASREPLERAIAIHTAQPDADPNETLRLQTLLGRIGEAA